MIDVGHDGGERFSGLTGGGCHRIDVSIKCDPTKYFDSSLLSAGGLPSHPLNERLQPFKVLTVAWLSIDRSRLELGAWWSLELSLRRRARRPICPAVTPIEGLQQSCRGVGTKIAIPIVGRDEPWGERSYCGYSVCRPVCSSSCGCSACFTKPLRW
jgi:hypothetical protein